ncbi:MAG: helix-turn-helix domain-containing protein [Agathobacter rectalis]
MEDKMEQKEFTQELKNKRLASGLSQGQLAELLHISRYSINRFENGKANAGKGNTEPYSPLSELLHQRKTVLSID